MSKGGSAGFSVGNEDAFKNAPESFPSPFGFFGRMTLERKGTTVNATKSDASTQEPLPWASFGTNCPNPRGGT